MSWVGDWMCGACQHMNLKKRDSCQRCGISKYGGQVEATTHGYNTNINRTEVLAGDWYCQAMNCGAHNYASRTICFRCSAQKSESPGGHYAGNTLMSTASYAGTEAEIPGWKTGDWICTRPGCSLHNYACRTECYKCKTPRDFGEKFPPSSS